MSEKQGNYSNQGGPRAGAGRPRELSKPRRTAFMLEERHIDFLREYGAHTGATSMSKQLRLLLDEVSNEKSVHVSIPPDLTRRLKDRMGTEDNLQVIDHVIQLIRENLSY